MDYIFQMIKESRQNSQIACNFSYLEIYNENVRDLLSENLKNLTLIEDPIKGVQAQDLKEFRVETIAHVEELIAYGNQRRALAATNQNQFSSRSHAILQLSVENKLSNGTILNSKLTFIDLAGSEKGTADKQAKGILEGANINKSLLALGNCINILSDNRRKNSHVPYRDSKLTRLLKDSLGGNTKTTMIACIS